VDSEIVSVTSAVGAMYVVPRVENLGSVHTAGVTVAVGEAEMEGVREGVFDTLGVSEAVADALGLELALADTDALEVAV
jgi:hypothetical protein